jgi:hypothetical protein
VYLDIIKFVYEGIIIIIILGFTTGSRREVPGKKENL